LGVNTLIGGAQADRFVLTGQSISDTLTPSTQAAAGMTGQRDLIDYSAAADGLIVNLGKTGTQQVVNTSASLAGKGLLTLTGKFDDLWGSTFNDKLTGDDLTNVIYGGGGKDTLAGGGVPPHAKGKPANHDFLVGNKKTKFVPPAHGSQEIDSKYRNGKSPFSTIIPIIVPEAIFNLVTPDPYVKEQTEGLTFI
jgi:Ca2+-binding RTX toxin-like protein